MPEREKETGLGLGAINGGVNWGGQGVQNICEKNVEGRGTQKGGIGVRSQRTCTKDPEVQTVLV